MWSSWKNRRPKRGEKKTKGGKKTPLAICFQTHVQRITYRETTACEVCIWEKKKKAKKQIKPADVFGIVSCFWAWLAWIPAHEREAKRENLARFCLLRFLPLWSNKPPSHVMTLTDVAPLYSATPPLPPHPPPLLGCVLNFLLHSSSKAKSSYATPHLTNHPPTHTPPCNSSIEQNNVESSKGSEVFSWAKPPQSASDELTWFESMLPLEL